MSNRRLSSSVSCKVQPSNRELSMTSQLDRATAFRQLHAADGAFVFPNPWDAGSAKMLTSLGFKALATTSAGLAFALGRPDAEGAISLEENLANAQQIVAATD